MTTPDNADSNTLQPCLAICTALPKELAACRLILDDPTPVNPPSADDGNQYWCGTLPSRANGPSHQVLLTSLAKMGNNVSSVAVTNLIRSFPFVEYILMVGIAGGVPDPRSAASHVRLGDVVVSNEKGVLQYDNVKRTLDHIEIRDNSPKPGAALIAAAKALESDFDLGRHPWEAHLSKAKHLPKFQRPASKTDVLYDAQDQPKSIRHPKDTWREQHPTSSRIHLAAIGSANTLLKDAAQRDRLRDEHGVRAIEMEGSGTADAAWSARRDYLVIRGICDYCDTHKNDDWQHYAALVAAAYARALIENLPYNPPQRHYDPGQIKNQSIDTANDRSSTQLVEAVDIEQLRLELGEAYAKRLESIIEKRGCGDINAAWESLICELARISKSSVPHLVQARFYYHAARWAQEDEKPDSQYTQYYQTAMRLDPSFDDRTYRAFEAVTAKHIDTAIYVFDETVTFFNSRGYHAKAVEVGNNLLDSPSVQVLQVDEPLFRAGWTLFQQHRDKRYSLTDCISFAVMRQLGIDAALAFDRHFAQAGFRMLPGSVELSGGEGARNRDYSFGGPRVTDRRGTLPSRKRPIK